MSEIYTVEVWFAKIDIYFISNHYNYLTLNFALMIRFSNIRLKILFKTENMVKWNYDHTSKMWKNIKIRVLYYIWNKVQEYENTRNAENTST